jgi:uncharacterized protein (DUF952 family)
MVRQMTDPLLHLLPSEAWARRTATTPLRAATLSTQGFAHCTVGDELMLRVANLFYTSEAGQFLVLSIDRQLLTSPVRWEQPPQTDALAGVAFPHVYGPIDAPAIKSYRTLERSDDGRFTGFGPVTLIEP